MKIIVDAQGTWYESGNPQEGFGKSLALRVSKESFWTIHLRVTDLTFLDGPLRDKKLDSPSVLKFKIK